MPSPKQAAQPNPSFLAQCLQDTTSPWSTDFAQSHGRSLRAVALMVARWSSSMVTSPFWRSAILWRSHCLMQASTSRGRVLLILVNCAYGAKSIGRNLISSSCCLDVCICTDASEVGFAFAVRESASWLRRLAGSQSGQGSRAAPGRGVAHPKGESCTDFPEVSLQLLDPSEWRLVAYGGFFRESCAGGGALQRTLKVFFTLISVVRGIFASGFREGFVLYRSGGYRQR